MAIAAESSLPTGPPLAADCWPHVSNAAALEARITTAAAAAVVATTTAATDSIIIAVDTPAVNAVDTAVAAPLAVAAGNNDEDVRTTPKRVYVISSATKISLRAYFEEADWPLNKALPRGAEFSCGPLGDIVRQCRHLCEQWRS